MGKHIKLFDTEAEYEAFKASEEYVEDHVSLTQDDHKVHYNHEGGGGGGGYYGSGTPVTLTFASAGRTVIITFPVDDIDGYGVEFKSDSTEWTSLTASMGANAGDTTKTYTQDSYSYTMPGDDLHFYIRGKVKHSSGYGYPNLKIESGAKSISGDYSTLVRHLAGIPEAGSEFSAKMGGVIWFCGGVEDASSLELPATELSDSCYSNMFYGCTKLAAAPALPATTLASDCYEAMFEGCTSLATAPELPAATLPSGCYTNMFEGCTSMSAVKCLATSGMGVGAGTGNWLGGVASSGTFTKAKGVEWPSGDNGIPEGWTVVEA